MLWNAARAWDRAGEIARAANRYERYLREAPAGARDRDSALQAVSRLGAKLGRIEVVGPGTIDIAVDERPLDGDRVYVTPGAHVVRGRADARLVTKTVTVAAGEASERGPRRRADPARAFALTIAAGAAFARASPPLRRRLRRRGCPGGDAAWPSRDSGRRRSRRASWRGRASTRSTRGRRSRASGRRRGSRTARQAGPHQRAPRDHARPRAVTAAATIVLARTAKGARVEVSAAPLPSLSLGGRF